MMARRPYPRRQDAPALVSAGTALRDLVSHFSTGRSDYISGMGPVGALLLAGAFVIVPLALYFMLPNSSHRRRLPLLVVAVMSLLLVLFVIAVEDIGG